MTATVALASYLPQLELQRLAAPATADALDAGLHICSLPLPRRAPQDWALGSMTTTALPLGQWADVSEVSPRRLLLIGQNAGGGSAASTLGLTRAGAAPIQAPPTAALHRFAISPEPHFMWERHALRIEWNGRWIMLAMGLRKGNDVHWWEHSRLVEMSASATCRTVHMGGAIPHTVYTAEDLRKTSAFLHPGLHVHHWLNAFIYARLHANGVCEIFARHVNTRTFDEGLPLQPAVPVIGIAVEETPANLRAQAGTWDGSKQELRLGGVHLDVAEVSRLATAAQPGRMDVAAPDTANGFGPGLIWQPYQGMELYGGQCPLERTGDPYVLHAKDQVIPRGMARTLSFTLSLNEKVSPRVARYLAPAWWYGVCEEYHAAPLLPARNDYNHALDAAAAWALKHQEQRGFEDGSVPRYSHFDIKGRLEPGWEGEMPAALFLAAYRQARADLYQAAARSAQHFTDVAIDHAAHLVRMTGFPPLTYAPPMNRANGTIYAWLETGDPFVRDAAVALVDHGHWHHKNTWPRMGMGRDASYLRSAVLLYRYLGDKHYLDIARSGGQDISDAQNADGSWGDQGGGSDIHGWGAYIVKPWMGCMATGPLLDLLELFPQEERFWKTVERFVEWLMRERFDHNGVMGWSYQHSYAGKRTFFDMYSGKAVTLPSQDLWHLDYLARLLTFASLRTGDPRYFQAWEESFQAFKDAYTFDHQVIQTLQFLPWVQDHLANATLSAAGTQQLPRNFHAQAAGATVLMGPTGA